MFACLHFALFADYIFCCVQMLSLNTEIFHILISIGSAHVVELVTWTWDLSPQLANICNQWMPRHGNKLSFCL